MGLARVTKQYWVVSDVHLKDSRLYSHKSRHECTGDHRDPDDQQRYMKSRAWGIVVRKYVLRTATWHNHFLCLQERCPWYKVKYALPWETFGLELLMGIR